jgi:hypothetical protein
MRLYKTTLSILLTTICSTFVHGQNIAEEQQQKKKIIPQFEFTQIDSLVDDAIHKIMVTDSQATVVASVRWFVGSYTEQTNKYSTHRNHFDIYIFNFTGKKCSVQKIDNFGYFKVDKIDASKVKDFLSSHFNDMQFEKLNPKIDTVYNANGSMTTSQSFIDHQLLQKIKIAQGTNKLNYEYPANYSDNKYNLLTKRFKFLNLVDELQKRYDRKKHKRTTLTYGLYNPEY